MADGYGNRRVIAVWYECGKFKRMWGAFGKPPEDDATSGGRGASGGPLQSTDAAEGGGRGRGAAPALDTEGDGSPTFASPVHGVMVSSDDIVYVVDRSNRRVQLFTPDGKYLRATLREPSGPVQRIGVGTCLFSPDKDQQFLYVSDYGEFACGRRRPQGFTDPLSVWQEEARSLEISRAFITS